MVAFKADKREIIGKKVKNLREGGLVPAVLYGQGRPSIPLVLIGREFASVYRTVGESSIADLEFGGEKEKVIVSSIQQDPVTGETLHVDFHRVEAGETVSVTIPIEFVGESSVIKSGQGMLLTLLSELEVECLPEDIPHQMEIDISGLAVVDAGIAIKDLPLDFAKVKVVGRPLDDLVVKIAEATMAEEEEVAEVAVEAVEATAEKGPKEETGEEAAPEKTPQE